MDAERETSECPLCKAQVATDVSFEGDAKFTHFRCPRCGEFGADKHCVLALRGPEPYPDLSGVAREMGERGVELRLTYTNLGEARKLARTTIDGKARRLLHAIAKRSQHPGRTIELNPGTDYPLAFGRDDDELMFFLDFLAELGWLGTDAESGTVACKLTPRGWIEVESDRSANVDSGKAFVAMWFASEMDDAYRLGIKPAIEDDAGFRAIRVDAVEHTGKIDDRIIAEIKESRFLVADFTGHRGGVYFEAGLAMGQGLPVIWLCRADQINATHFD